MRKNFGSKPICYPQPVFILGTYDENGIPDAMNAAEKLNKPMDEIEKIFWKNAIRVMKETL